MTAVAQPKENIPTGNLVDIVLLKEDTPNPVPVSVPNSILCNCWAYVKSVYPSLPPTSQIKNNLVDVGSVAVFYYSQVGLHHYAVVVAVTDDGYIIEETNYKRCQKGSRTIPKDDPSLLGFFHI